MTTTHRPATASDYMQRDLVTVSSDDTFRTALTLMTQNHVTGLPVVDGRSRCIGMVTSTDILSYEQEAVADMADGRMVDIFDPDSQQWETISLSAFGLEGCDEIRVRDVMTSELLWVERDTPIRDVARRMVEERVHRLLVMDDSARLYGIVSATDIVRFVAES